MRIEPKSQASVAHNRTRHESEISRKQQQSDDVAKSTAKSESSSPAYARAEAARKEEKSVGRFIDTHA